MRLLNEANLAFILTIKELQGYFLFYLHIVNKIILEPYYIFLRHILTLQYHFIILQKD